MFWNIFMKVTFGLIPPSVWRLFRGGRLAQRAQGNNDRRGIDMDVFVWEIAVSITSLAAIFFGLIAFGVIPTRAQVALASEQQAAAKQVIATRIEQLEWRIFDLTVKQCDAIKKGESARIYTLELIALIKTYTDLVGKQPDLPSCTQL